MGRIVCPSCGRRAATARELPEYRYVDSGLDNVILQGGVTEIKCGDCRKKHIRIEKENQLLQVIALVLLVKKGHLTGREMRFLRGACEMSQEQLADALNCRRATISERESRQGPKHSLAEELLLRAVFLRSFNEYLDRPRSNYLAPSHLRRLKKLSASFVDQLERLAEQISRSKKLKATLDEKDDRWEILDDAA